MPLLSPEHIRILADPDTWHDNPFLARDARRDARRGQPARSLAVMLVTVSVLGALAMWGLLALGRWLSGVPWALGGSYGMALAIVIVGVHVWFVGGAVQKNTSAVYDVEANRNTLSALLMLPDPAFRTCVRAGAYGWVAGMRMALAGLPLYAFCVALDGPTPLDVLLLYAVFALLCATVPLCARPMRADQVAFAAPTPGKPAAATARPTAVPASVGMVPFLLVLVTSIMPRVRLAATLRATVGAYVPDHVLQLLPSCPLSWPLVVARSLVTPYDWYGWPVWPLPFLLLGLATLRYVQAVRTSLFLRSGDYAEMALLPEYLPNRRLQAIFRAALCFVATGYLWKWLVVDGGAAGLVGRVAPGTTPGLLGLTWALGAWAALSGVWAGAVAGMAQTALRPDNARTHRTVAVRTVLRSVIGPWAYSAAFLLVCCVLARVSPVVPQVWTLWGRLAAIGLAGALLSYAANSRIAGAFGLSVLVAPAVFLAPAAFAPLMALSPLLGVVSHANLPAIALMTAGLPVPAGLHAFLTHAPAWWIWPGLSAPAAVLLLLRPARQPKAKKDKADSRPAAERPPEPVALDAAVYPAEAFQDPPRDPTPKPDPPAPVGDWLLRCFMRVSDNAVAIRDLRPRLRKLTPQWTTSALVGCAIVSAVALTPFVTGTFGELLGPILFGSRTHTPADALTAALSVGYAISVFMAFGLGMAVVPNSFLTEWQRSTLPFLLATPLRARDIVAGKAAAHLLGFGPALLAVYAWLLLASVLAAPLVGGAAPLAVWAEAAIMVAAIVVTLTSLGLAVASLFPRAASMQGCTMVALVLGTQVVAQLAVFAHRGAVRLIATAVGALGGHPYAVLALAVVVVNVLCILIAVYGVKRMRKGDIAEGAAKRAT